MKHLFIAILSFISLNTMADCSSKLKFQAERVLFDDGKITFGTIGLAGGAYLLHFAGSSSAGALAYIASITGYTTYDTAKEYFESEEAKKILHVFTEAELGYGVFLNRFMHEVDPTASKAQIIPILTKIQADMNQCKISITSYEDLIDMTRESLQ